MTIPPWAFIAHKGRHWGGVCRADKTAGKFLAPFIAKGYSVLTVYSREQYLAELAKRKAFSDDER